MVARRTRAAAKADEAAAGGGEGEAVPAAVSSSEGEEAGGDEEAPEEVTFESARVAAEEARRSAGERARREKAILKEKRRQREELFKEQKKRKLLPENVLEELASSTQESRNQPCDTPENDKSQDVEGESETEHTKEEEEEETVATRLQENYMAVRLKDRDLTNKQQQVAKNFVQRLLYGAGSNRTTANQYFSVENKKRAVKKAAVQFVSNSWGKTKKQKAKRFTKHWVSSKITP
uniref:U3 small nucleolar RNA-associated protein NOL7 isoform X1 n=1 Tax=Pogona vitticeps TaxID=103695 RepID=A0A6J0U0V9_9SAUR